MEQDNLFHEQDARDLYGTLRSLKSGIGWLLFWADTGFCSRYGLSIKFIREITQALALDGKAIRGVEPSQYASMSDAQLESLIIRMILDSRSGKRENELLKMNAMRKTSVVSKK